MVPLVKLVTCRCKYDYKETTAGTSEENFLERKDTVNY